MGDLCEADTGTVLARFEAENVRSFRDPVELSMVATRLAEAGAARTVRANDRGGTVRLLPVAYKDLPRGPRTITGQGR